jgi:cytochrome c heme-lyase
MAWVLNDFESVDIRYVPPFDRHDWTVDRCGKQIEYVIDFYSGDGNSKEGGKISFHLDVRPKLTVEGARMRFERWIGEWIPKGQATEQDTGRK